MFLKLSLHILVIAALFSLTGCGGDGTAPELGTVTGTVTLDGDPLPDATVLFQPETGRPSVGITDSDGKYSLKYIEAEGAKVGKHTVSITTRRGGGDVGDDPGAGVGDGTEEAEAPAGKPVPELVPDKYNIRSELKVEVVAGSNTHDFKLLSK